VRSLLIIGASAAVFVIYLVAHHRDAREILRAEEAALEKIVALREGPPGPPHSAGGYRFAWTLGGDLPPFLLASPDAPHVVLFATTPGGSVYAYDLFGAAVPDVTALRVHAARAAENPPLPAGWKRIR
jgi:hypothetical protein